MKNRSGRRSALYGALLALTILAGLLSRSALIPLPVFVATYAGDALWALMVYWWCCLLKPRWETWRLALAALSFSFAIETSQLYHAPWIDALRDTTLGAVVLGFGFLASDLVCYAVGVGVGAGIDYAIRYVRARFRSVG